MNAIINTSAYREWLEALKTNIQQSQIKAAIQVKWAIAPLLANREGYSSKARTNPMGWWFSANPEQRPTRSLSYYERVFLSELKIYKAMVFVL